MDHFSLLFHYRKYQSQQKILYVQIIYVLLNLTKAVIFLYCLTLEFLIEVIKKVEFQNKNEL